MGSLIALGTTVYVLAMFYIAYRASGESDSLDEYLLAGRNLSLGICTASITASWFGSGPMLGTAAAAYSDSKLDLLFDPIACSGCLIIIGLLFIKALRRSRKLTWIQIVEDRLGKVAGVIASLVDMAGEIMWLGGVLFAFGVVFETLTGTDATWSVVIGTLVVVVYTLVGGLRAVAFTDALQMTLIVLGLLVLLQAVVSDIGKIGPVFQALSDVLRFTPATNSSASWADYIHIWVAAGLGGALSTSVLQRGMAARTEQESQLAFLFAGVAYFFLALIPVALGAAAVTLLPGIDDPNGVIPALALEYLHPLLAILFIGAILSAIMSTSDSILLSVGTVVSTNLLPLFVRDPSEGLRLTVAKLTIPIAAGVAVGFALNGEAVLEIIFDSLALVTAGVIGPFMLGLWWSKTNRLGALVGMLAGLVSYFVLLVMGFAWPDLVAFFGSVILTVVGSLLSQGVDQPRPLKDIDGGILSMDGTVGFSMR